jgi:NADPH:quinone reductase-like Zn-dependent oxidoreductase
MAITRHGGPEVFAPVPAPDRAPGRGEVRIRARAAGLNFADVFARMGLYEAAPPPPFVPGFEAAGTVEAVGEGVTRVAPGDRVVGCTRFGGYAQTIYSLERLTLKIPDGVSFEEAAGLPAVYATAHHALFRLGHVEEGQTVLVHAAAGGVGMAAIALARGHGARVLATCGGARKVEVVRSWGVDEVLDYTAHDFEPWVRARTQGRGVDLVLDSVGGESFKKSYRLLAPIGHLVMFGMAGFCPTAPRPSWISLALEWLRQPRFSPLHMLPENRTVSGFNLVYMFQEDSITKRMLPDLERLWHAGKLPVHVDRTFPLEEAGAAQEYLRRRQSVGKVILAMP